MLKRKRMGLFRKRCLGGLVIEDLLLTLLFSPVYAVSVVMMFMGAVTIPMVFFGYVAWAPLLVLGWLDYASCRRGRIRKAYRRMNMVCAGAIAATLSYKIVMNDVWTGDPDFRGGMVVLWFCSMAMLAVMYAMKKLLWTRDASPSPGRSGFLRREIHPALVYLSIHVVGVVLAVMIGAFNRSHQFGPELLFIVAAGLTTLIAVLNGRRVCARSRVSLAANDAIFLFSLIGLGTCHFLADSPSFAHWGSGNWKMAILWRMAAGFGAVSLMAAIFRTARNGEDAAPNRA